MTIPCIIPQKHHRSLMGPKGVKVQNITSQFDVAIKFPERPQQASPTSPGEKVCKMTWTDVLSYDSCQGTIKQHPEAPLHAFNKTTAYHNFGLHSVSSFRSLRGYNVTYEFLI